MRWHAYYRMYILNIYIWELDLPLRPFRNLSRIKKYLVITVLKNVKSDCSEAIGQKLVEKLLIFMTGAIIDPWAVMVESTDAFVAK